MNQTEKIQELIAESKNHTFSNNCETSRHGTYGRPSVDLRVWFSDTEDFILSNYGVDSAPAKLFKKSNIDLIEENGQDTFDIQVSHVISALKMCLRISSGVTGGKSIKPLIKQNFSKVFIVHGHDEEAQSKTARFIEKLGFEPIILQEQASSGNTIIEKIEEYSNVGFGIVLYTPCDVGSKQTKTPDLKSRARQNVVFEHGYLIGRIGRDKVCALVKGDIETPNDISGVVYISMDNANAWHMKIAKELKKAGYNVDANKIIN